MVEHPLPVGHIHSVLLSSAVFSNSCEDIDDGSSFRITCTGAEGSDQIVSYTYTLNGETSEISHHETSTVILILPSFFQGLETLFL